MRISDGSSDVCSSDLKLKVVDEVVKEPLGGAHRDPKQALADLGDVLDRHLRDLAGQEPGSLREARRRKFLELGSVDRKSVVDGKSVSGRVDTGGRRILKKKKTQRITEE